jgi:hypothetical protein
MRASDQFIPAFNTLAAAFPVHDWQFWVVTAMFLLAVLWLARGLLPWKRGGRARGKTTRVSLTVGGKTPDDRKTS